MSPNDNSWTTAPAASRDAHTERRIRDGDGEVADADRLSGRYGAALLAKRDETAVFVQDIVQITRRRPAWEQRHADRLWRHGRDAELDWLTGDDQVLSLRVGVDAEEERGASGAEALESHRVYLALKVITVFEVYTFPGCRIVVGKFFLFGESG